MSKQFHALLLVLTSVAGCSSPPQPVEPAPSAITAIAKMGQLATDPVVMFSLTFDGNPAQQEIREKLDAALSMYGLEVNNENLARAGNALVGLRKEHGHSEMWILDKMLNSPADGANLEAAAARIASTVD